MAVALTGALALGLTGSSVSHPVRAAGQPRHRAVSQGTFSPPRGVITQARARQRRRHRNTAATAAAAAGIGAARAAGMGSPPARGRRSRHRHADHGGSPPPPRAEQLRGLPAHGQPIIDGLSCPSAGDCALNGTYYTRPYVSTAFVASEVRGHWGRATSIAGIPAGVTTAAAPVTCPSPGNCIAAGYYVAGRHGAVRIFVVTERNGIWGSAQQIRGLASSHKDPSVVDAVSCASAGNCAIGGSSATGQPFVLTEADGRWSGPRPILGLPAPPSPHWISAISAISCASAGNCSAAGTYTEALPHQAAILGAFVVDEIDGVWGRAQLLRGTLVYPSLSLMMQISCAAPGDCGLIVSSHFDRPRAPSVAFVVSEVRGTWGTPEPVPGLRNGHAELSGLSCPAPGDCAADGEYGHWCTHLYTVTEADGTWHDAQAVPGTTGGCSYVSRSGPLSCASAGDCLMGGSTGQAATATETDGTWHAARAVPGVTAVNGRGSYVSGVDAVSCSPGGPCASAGVYRPSNAAPRVFVVG